jgi:hypothetical protein
MIRFACPACSRTLEVPEERGGGTVGCPNCDRPVSVPTLLPVDAALAAPAGAKVAARARGWYRPQIGINPMQGIVGLAARALPLWRFGSPSSLLLAFLLFFLPWIEVRCDRPVGDRGSKSVAVQSGFQAAYGGYSEVPLSHTAGSERDRIEAQVRALQGDLKLTWAPLMVVYPLVVLGGSLFGLLAWRHRFRSAVLVGCSLTASLLLLLQTSRGFPLEQAARTLEAKGRLASADFRIALSTSGLLEVGYMAWFWLSAVALGSALTATCAEWWLTHRSGRGREVLRTV